MSVLEPATWSIGRAGDAAHALAAHCGLAPRPLGHTAGPVNALLDDEAEFGRWIEAVARSAGIALEPVETTYAELDRFLVRGAPALVKLPRGGIVALAGCRRDQVVLIGPDRAPHRAPREALRAALVEDLERPQRADVERFLDELAVADTRRAHARAVVLAERLGSERVGQAWLVRLPDGAAARARIGRTRIPRRLAALLATHVLEYGLWLLAWVLVGRAVLEGRLDPGWLLAWALLLGTLVPLRAFGTWLGGSVTVEAGGLLRRRLLAGALRLEPEEVRHQGVGQLLGRVLESDAIDGLALGGGLATMTAAIELVIVLGVLIATGFLLLAGLLVGWVVLVLALGWRCLRCRDEWSGQRLEMTHDLVEQMVGHRTRQAQAAAGQWHEGEDEALEQYLARSRTMDRATVVLESVASRGWLVVALAALAPTFVAGVAVSPLAVALGCVLLVSRALRSGAGGLTQLAGAAIAWRQIAPLFAAATRTSSEGVPLAHVVASARGSRSDGWLLEAHELSFRHPGRSEPLLKECTLRMRTGDRVLLQGASGAGKSTLASLLVGLRVPQAGLLLLGGLDRQSLGARAWRRRVVAAPQFHENHVFSGTFLFNALMGCDRWPPRQRDLAEVEAICRELGLGELLDRMPAGLFQMVGETGWQLSHGERSRLFLARALLQEAALVVLDESFAALDPENLERALRCVLARARTLVVIAHP